MANENQLGILRQGIEAWNKWRGENPDESIDLREADLSGANLWEANLSGADLREANLSRAHLSGANLFEANLFRTNLSAVDPKIPGRIHYQGADLSRAILIKADLREADLVKADLNYADLSGANLSGANLSGANLWEANLLEANLFRTNLSVVNPEISRKLYRGADLREAYLVRADLREANLIEAHLSRANLSGADLREANLSRAYLGRADLREANLGSASLREANLSEANLEQASLSEANLSGADLTGANLSQANLKGAILTGCKIFAVSAWGLELDDKTEQRDLVITLWDEPVITVDDIEVAQFIYLLLHSDKMRRVIDTLTSKTVLILGRFTPERKAVLDAIREELRKRDYVPLLFDFEKPSSRDLTETVSTLAHMARFIIADVTEAKSIPAELERIVPDLPSVPVMPLVLQSDREYALFEHIRRFPWVLKPYEYESQAELIASIGERIIMPAEIKIEEDKRARSA